METLKYYVKEYMYIVITKNSLVVILPLEKTEKKTVHRINLKGVFFLKSVDLACKDREISYCLNVV